MHRTCVVQKEGVIVYAKGFGYAVEEFDVLLDPDQTIQIGSNSKLFTAVGTARTTICIFSNCALESFHLPLSCVCMPCLHVVWSASLHPHWA